MTFKDMKVIAQHACTAVLRPKPSDDDCYLLDSHRQCDHIEALNCLVDIHTKVLPYRMSDACRYMYEHL